MKLFLAPLAAAFLFVAAATQAADGPSIILLDVMKGTVAPQAQILWDVGNRGMDDEGKADGSKLSAADWSKLSEAAIAMKGASTSMASASRMTTVAPGGKLQNEGEPGSFSAAQVQAFIDADPKAFATYAQALAEVSEEFAQAARTKDAAKLMDASGKLDAVCEACHMQFWYPEQAAAK